MVFPAHVLMRFGRWEEILKEPEPAENLPLSRALRLFARATALAALKRADEADREREAFRTAAKAVPKEWTFGNASGEAILEIASAVLDGEILAQRGRHDEAVAVLRKAVSLEDALRYDEPPDWILPVRHTLGATLLATGKGAEAAEVYREDLVRWPKNAWALAGLARSLHLQGKHAEAHAADAEADAAWADADIPRPETSCLCLPGK
jgi:predicted Zn-dependent protease